MPPPAALPRQALDPNCVGTNWWQHLLLQHCYRSSTVSEKLAKSTLRVLRQGQDVGKEPGCPTGCEAAHRPSTLVMYAGHPSHQVSMGVLQEPPKNVHSIACIGP